MLLIHNPEYWIKEYLSSLFLPLYYSHFYITSFYRVSSRFGAGRKRAYFYTTPPLSLGQVSKAGRYSSESPVWNLYSFSFFADLCFCPTGKVVKSLRFNMWMNKFQKYRLSEQYCRFSVVKTGAIFLPQESYPNELMAFLAK